MTDPLRQLAMSDQHYALEAYQFLFEALDHAVNRAGRQGTDGQARHVSGQELLEAMREHGAQLFGPLAAQVWRAWGIHETLDWGKVVFRLVDARLLNRRDEDSIDDFRDGFDLDEAFVNRYRPVLPEEIRVTPVEDEP